MLTLGFVKVTRGYVYSFATQNFIRGISLELIGAMMGHRNISTTMKYTNVKQVEALRRAFEK
jgi:site-specific recombinase XerD